MTEAIPRSRKLRALRMAYDQPLSDLAETFSRSVYTYEEIATHWQAKVSERFPELGLCYSTNDVYRLFNRFEIRRSAVPVSEAAA